MILIFKALKPLLRPLEGVYSNERIIVSISIWEFTLRYHMFLRALEERKKVAEEREARKRALQLSKRRQRQTEATERYQRAHLPSKPTSGKARPFSGENYFVVVIF